MPFVDSLMDFSNNQALSGTSAQNSTNVYDAGSAKKVFGGESGRGKIGVEVLDAGGTTPTFQAQFVGADDAALSSNVVVLADTGTSPTLSTTAPPTGVALATYQLRPAMQLVAKRYYGLIYKQTGTSPTAHVNAHYYEAQQTNLVQ